MKFSWTSLTFLLLAIAGGIFFYQKHQPPTLPEERGENNNTFLTSAAPSAPVQTPSMPDTAAVAVASVPSAVPSLNQVEQSLEAVNELLHDVPLNYEAQKEKLKLLLQRQRLSGEESADQVNSVIEDMMDAALAREVPTAKEAVLMAQAQAQASEMENRLAQLEQTRLQLADNLESMDENSLQALAAQARSQELWQEEEEIVQELQALEEEVENQIIAYRTYLNEDIVHIPFQLERRQEDWKAMEEDAQELIELAPNSHLGYYYLIEAIAQQSSWEEAVEVLSYADLPPEEWELLQRRLRALR